MRQRGRKSTASLFLVTPQSETEALNSATLDPPVGMPDAQARVWRAVVDSLGASWFRPEQLPLLTQYCRHVVASNTVAAKIEELLALPVEAGEWPLFAKTYAALLKAQRDESASIAMLATKMRIAQQSTYDKSKRKPTTASKPWE